MKLVFVVCTIFFVGAECCGDFYWRDYNGTIPYDALPAGNLSYIGQAYIHNYGLIIGTIIPGNREMVVPCDGVKTTDIIIKVLCTPRKEDYTWIPTAREYYEDSIANRCPVVGGYDEHDVSDGLPGTLHVGRVIIGNPIVGIIAYYKSNDLWFYYPLRNEVVKSGDWEVLVYNDHPITT